MQEDVEDMLADDELDNEPGEEQPENDGKGEEQPENDGNNGKGDDEEDDDSPGWDGFSDDDDDDQEEDDDDDDYELTESEKKYLDRRINKVSKPIQEQMAILKREKDVNDFLNQGRNREIYGKFADKITANALHKNGRSLPVKAVADAVAGSDYLIKLGAKMSREADDEANETVHRGSPARGVSSNGSARKSGGKGNLPDFRTMSDEEFDKWEAENGIMG